MQIHQPVAVAPSTRTIHGPNGLLGQAGPLGGSNQLGAPMSNAPAAGPMYGNAPAQHDQTTPRMQHAVQAPPQPQMLMPFNGPPGAMGMGQGQQPILNVSPCNSGSWAALTFPGCSKLPRPSESAIRRSSRRV
jgi:paired amphipathic helix protein Sin3a